MRTVTRQTFERKCRDGEWDCEWEPNAFGYATVRNPKNNNRFMVTLRDRETVKCA